MLLLGVVDVLLALDEPVPGGGGVACAVGECDGVAAHDDGLRHLEVGLWCYGADVDALGLRGLGTGGGADGECDAVVAGTVVGGGGVGRGGLRRVGTGHLPAVEVAQAWLRGQEGDALASLHIRLAEGECRRGGGEVGDGDLGREGARLVVGIVGRGLDGVCASGAEHERGTRGPCAADACVGAFPAHRLHAGCTLQGKGEGCASIERALGHLDGGVEVGGGAHVGQHGGGEGEVGVGQGSVAGVA